MSELSTVNPIRKIVLYKSTEYPMVYEVGRLYGSRRLKCCRIEIGISESGTPFYYIFVNKIENGETDGLEYLWKTETSNEISVEYDLEFDVYEL